MAKRKKESQSFGKMSFDDILNLAPEKFRELMKAEETAYYHELKDMGDSLYPGYNFEEKVRFWEAVLNRQMRRQAESGLDEYAIYSPSWYVAIKRIEPAFDEIMDKVFEQPGFHEWSRQEYFKRIQHTRS
ncbi:MAG: hypothetical protein J0H85_13755 [Sediminibacterium magnilacihabitans]|jgi:hypothetical protein|nr:hypothetical protein [Sediminibacterium magnilacihabitans]PQV59493.1 hypothetical protein CLV53_11854 [Sediminibacterium magnilacihabitans]